MTKAMPPWLALWGKAQPAEGAVASWHPLACHMLDVAAVAGALWDRRVSKATQDRLSEVFDHPREAVTIAAAFHDLGKATPTFQRMVPDAVGRLMTVGLTFPERDAPERHGVLTDALASSVLGTMVGWSQGIVKEVLALAGSHHGNTFATPVTRRQAEAESTAGDTTWVSGRAGLAAAVLGVLGPAGVTKTAEMPIPAGVLLGGLIVVADWIGSNTEWFPYVVLLDATDIGSYYETACQRAVAALDALALIRWEPPALRSWEQRFPSQPNPRPLQSAAITVSETLNEPAIVVIEADTGEGKTEAALWIAETLVRTTGASGLYVALPTRATADQMYERVGKFVAGDSTVQLALCHGTSSVAKALEQLRRDPRMFHDLDIEHGESADGMVVADSWFSSSKRGLLSPVGVGTVDQIILAAQPARHWWLRMFALSQSVLVIDEAHAYDTYQQDILETLLYWCGLCGTSVLILSATLPVATRMALITAWRRGAGVTEPAPALARSEAYPSITAATTVSLTVETFDADRPRCTPIEWISEDDRANLAVRLSANGDSVLVVCNTVARAQALYAEISAVVEDWPVICYHARFPTSVRSKIHECIERRWGPDATDRSGICVGTQVVEQSLDVDFDWLITDLAPVDLLVQRRGRTRRHPQRVRSARASGDDRIYVVAPNLQDGVPAFDRGTAAVYDEYVLTRTYLELSARGKISTPTDLRELVNAVYSDKMAGSENPELHAALVVRWGAWRDTLGTKHLDASLQYITNDVSGEYDRRAAWGAKLKDEDSGALFRARSRWGPDSVQVVCLLEREDGAYQDLDLGDSVGIDVSSASGVRDLMRAMCPFPTSYVGHLEQPTAWKSSGPLAHSRLLLVRPDGTTTDQQLSYERETGFRRSRSKK